ncbi:putative GTP-binding protein [Porphyridium purpureum]|uniref:Putative GTP-binding protein n=1 Tax=Porphyridium purpureum TaxID=35688 RepID=A0A5J4Z1N4_PORPP|nr:putative GTP-binding protein [Porphyridium purpureum]|eukprot:POR3340..scf208_2
MCCLRNGRVLSLCAGGGARKALKMAGGILERIAEIEKEMSRTQKNKATEYHLGLLKSKLAKLRTQLIQGEQKTGPAGTGFEVVKYGDARVAMVGFPSVGKSTFLSTVTKTESEAAAYEFTTLTCIPGILYHNGATIQLLDLPGIISGASEGKGRGRQVIGVARSADLILLMLDATKADVQRPLLEKELESVGIRLNKSPPNVYFKPKATGGLKFTAIVPLTHLNEKLVYGILHEYKVHNADVIVREDCTVDDFIDIVEGNRQYIRCLNVVNKIDSVSIEEVDRLARYPHTVVLSCNLRLNVDTLISRIWDDLRLCRVYTKKRGHAPDFTDPLVLRAGCTVQDACRAVHRSLAEASRFKYALVWGRSTKHNPQRVGFQHLLADEDVMQIVTR